MSAFDPKRTFAHFCSRPIADIALTQVSVNVSCTVDMPKTFGISHIAMQVADLDRSMAFYESAFEVRRHHRDATTAMLLGPGLGDLIALELSPSEAGKRGGIQHFGFRLTSPDHFDDVLAKALSAGGRLKEKGDRGDNQPYAFVTDPDGYEIEIWHMNARLFDNA